jgi:hypothetical protein
MSCIWCIFDIGMKFSFDHIRMLLKAIILPIQIRHAVISGQSIMN